MLLGALAPIAVARPTTSAAEADARAIQEYSGASGRPIVPPVTPPTAAAPLPTITPPTPIQPFQPFTEEGRFGFEPNGGATNPGPAPSTGPVVTSVPLPTPVGLGMAGLLLVAAIRRRRA